MRKPVTTDMGVLASWPNTKKPVTSQHVANALKITVFQITARLKGMEGRSLVARDEKGLWLRTGKEATPEPVRAPRIFKQGGPAVGLPDDSKVPRIKKPQWISSEAARAEAASRLEEVESRLDEYKVDKKRFRREIMALEVERDHCKKLLAQKAKGCWTVRHENTATVFIAPDRKEYVPATAFETADLLIEPGLMGPVRLRLYHTSRVGKAIIKEKEEQTARAKAKQDEREQRIKEEEAREKEIRRELSAIRKSEKQRKSAIRSAAGVGRRTKGSGPAKKVQPHTDQKGRGGNGSKAQGKAQALPRGRGSDGNAVSGRPQKTGYLTYRERTAVRRARRNNK